MNPTYAAYMSEIGASNAAIERAEKLIYHYKNLTDLDPEEIFVCTQRSDDGILVSSLWIITKEHISEIKNFLTESSIDFISSAAELFYVDFSYSDTDLREFRDTSYVYARVNAGGGLHMMFFACGNNCKYLLDLMRRRIIHAVKPAAIS